MKRIATTGTLVYGFMPLDWGESTRALLIVFVVGGMVHCERRCELLKAAHAFAVLVVPRNLQGRGVTPIARAPPKPLPTLY